MKKRTLGLFAMLIAAIALLLCGCGGGDRLSEEEYGKKLTDIGTRMQNVGTDFSDLNNVKTLADANAAVPRVKELANKIRGYASELKGINPPEKYDSFNGELASILESYGKVIDKMAEAYGSKTEEEMQEKALGMTSDLFKVLQDMQSCMNKHPDLFNQAA